MDLMERLRTETRQQHEQLHEVVDVSRMTSSVAAYTTILTRFYQAVRPVEAGVQQAVRSLNIADPAAGLWSERLVKADWLQQDLAALNQQLPSAESTTTAGDRSAAEFAECGSPELLIGRTYVLEGMTLGATRIAPELQRHLSVTADSGGRFYGSYGSDTGRFWQAYKRWATDQPLDDPDLAVQSAQRTFSFFAYCLAGRMSQASRVVSDA